MITALTWVPKGAARVKPVRFELSQDEYARIKLLAKAEEESEKLAEQGDVGEGDEPEHAASGLTFTDGDAEMNEEDTTELPPELRMDEYDDDSEHEDNDEEENNFAVSPDYDLIVTKGLRRPG
jgi:hypothetical protein